MASTRGFIDFCYNFYKFAFTDSADPRTNDWFLISSPVSLLGIMTVYLFFVTRFGPRYISERKPLDLSRILILYNFLQVLLSAVLVYEALDGLLLREDFSLKCQPLSVGRTREAMREARCLYLYFLAKISELLDTVFFILRKKMNQVTFLHIYHHSVMPFISWGFVKYCPGGHVIFIVCLNSFVHVVMYSYYLLAALGPRFQKYLWWKKYITVMQMVQFLAVALHNIQLLYRDCNYPKASLLFVLTNSFIFMYLFNDFYGKAYKKMNSTDLLEKHSSNVQGLKSHKN